MKWLRVKKLSWIDKAGKRASKLVKNIEINCQNGRKVWINT
jgi:hypothetical protein